MDQSQHAQSLGSTAPPALSDAIERIMSNPELISMVASALGKGTSSESEPKSDVEEAPRVQEADASARSELPALVDALGPLLSRSGEGRGESKSNGACLLRALKPYVSQGRREAIDAMIRISDVSEILKKMR